MSRTRERAIKLAENLLNAMDGNICRACKHPKTTHDSEFGCTAPPNDRNTHAYVVCPCHRFQR